MLCLLPELVVAEGVATIARLPVWLAVAVADRLARMAEIKSSVREVMAERKSRVVLPALAQITAQRAVCSRVARGLTSRALIRTSPEVQAAQMPVVMAVTQKLVLGAAVVAVVGLVTTVAVAGGLPMHKTAALAAEAALVL